MTKHQDAPFSEPYEPNSYYDPRFEKQAVKILPGEYFATSNDIMIVTVLGSCVSVCLRDPFAGIGGMNHFLLPNDHAQQQEQFSRPARYGRHAIDILISEIEKLGALRTRLEAKVFGGGNVLKGLTVSNIGDMNSDFVLNYLSELNIPIAAQDLLDIYPRKVYFFPKTGQVLVKKIKHLNNTTIVERESAYRMKLSADDQWHTVEK